MMNKKKESKTEKYSVATICKKMDQHVIRFNHPAQRCSEQWNNKMKGNLISDILQGNPVPAIVLAEQIMNGVSIIWDLDGKQRCTNVYNYVHDGFKISKSVRRSVIYYQAPKVDDKGKPMLDDQMVPIMEWKEFNIANKFFSQLPEVLQDRIMDYCFDAVLYLDCSSEDIVYHIARYNDGKPMNKVQKGVVNLGEDFATEVKQLADHSFFVDYCDFGKGWKTNGNVDRCVCETIMASNHIDNWGGNNLEAMCEFLKDNADVTEFEDMEDNLNSLEEVIDDETGKLFTNKEAFIWLTVYNRYVAAGGNNEKFGEFLTEYVKGNMREKEVDGVRYKDLEESRCTKDKSMIIKKVAHIETLMKKCFEKEVGGAA